MLYIMNLFWKYATIPTFENARKINSSLAALKECVRCKAAGKTSASGAAAFLPYRKSRLTHLLRACFEDENPTVVIATVSPSSKDTEHSLNTIRHACIMDGQVEWLFD